MPSSASNVLSALVLAVSLGVACGGGTSGTSNPDAVSDDATLGETA